LTFNFGGESDGMVSQKFGRPFGFAIFECLNDRLVELCHPHHVVFFGSEKNTGSNLETKTFPSAK
jgi:hypothetical protein